MHAVALCCVTQAKRVDGTYVCVLVSKPKHATSLWVLQEKVAALMGFVVEEILNVVCLFKSCSFQSWEHMTSL